MYGAIDLSSGTPQVIIPSAASTAATQNLNSIVTGLSQAQGTSTVAARDLIPLPADDPPASSGADDGRDPQRVPASR